MNKGSIHFVEVLPPRDDLDREVCTVLGVPIDVIDMKGVVDAIDAAASRGTPFLMSTPNLNFLITSRVNPEFKESLLMSDLCIADGMPIIWIARLLGLPIHRRVAGSDVVQALKCRTSDRPAKRVFLFGGEDGVAAAASAKLNSEATGLICAGALCPGFGSVENMSSDEIISTINASRADFLLVALGAAKGQEWLRRNHHRLTVPVRSHLGAALNFQARALKRAPALLQRLGLEWLWRIKEEPRLWRRYWHDGWSLLTLLFTRIAPLVWATIPSSLRHCTHDELRVECVQSISSVTVRLAGSATAPNARTAAAHFRGALAAGQPLVVDLSETRHIDARFFGLFLTVRKAIAASGGSLRFVGVSPALRRTFALHDVDFLTTEDGALRYTTNVAVTASPPRVIPDAA